MDILVIGNGFDLAHGLPTRYSDFLTFLHEIRNLVIKNEGKHFDNNQDILNKLQVKEFVDNYFKNVFSTEESAYLVVNKLQDKIINNIWVTFFQTVYSNKSISGQNWIDFEQEIKKIIMAMYTFRKKFGSLCFDSFYKGEIPSNLTEGNELLIDDNVLLPVYSVINASTTKLRLRSIDYELLKRRMRIDLSRFIEAMDIYFGFFVKGFSTNVILPDFARREVFKHVLSFNYVNNYERFYCSEEAKIRTCYVHGNTRCGNFISNNLGIKNNMVLGFEEYLSGTDKDNDLEFVYYKKYFQRILKGTGNEYLSWLKLGEDDMTANDPDALMAGEIDLNHKNHIYIFGHSLDITDREVLRELILRDSVKTTIYYHDEEAHERLILNLIKIIGQEQLITKTHGNPPDIEFVKQRPPSNN